MRTRRKGDEGEAPGGQPWSDLEDPSLDGSDESESDIEASRAGGEALVLSEEQAVAVGEVTERLRRIDGMVAQARAFGNPHIIMTLEQARLTLLKQCAELGRQILQWQEPHEACTYMSFT